MINLEIVIYNIQVKREENFIMSNVCLCKGVSEEKIVEAVKNGALSFEEVGEKTGAGTGACCGARCKCKIEELIEENK